MTFKLKFQNPTVQGFARIILGVALAFVLYQLALNFATRDCQAIHQEIMLQGPWTIVKLLALCTAASIIGIPAILIAITVGVLTGPFLGAPLTSLAITLSSVFLWIITRYAFPNGMLPNFIEKNLHGAWYDQMMSDRTISGFHWTATHGMTAPIPYAFFAGIAGAKVRHLNFQSLIAGIFAGSILQVAGYSLAGASIGCAVINHALGLSINQYRALIAVSCVILILLSRLQSSMKTRNET